MTMDAEEPTTYTETDAKTTIYQFEKSIRDKNVLYRSKVLQEVSNDNSKQEKDENCKDTAANVLDLNNLTKEQIIRANLIDNENINADSVLLRENIEIPKYVSSGHK